MDADSQGTETLFWINHMINTVYRHLVSVSRKIIPEFTRYKAIETEHTEENGSGIRFSPGVLPSLDSLYGVPVFELVVIKKETEVELRISAEAGKDIICFDGNGLVTYLHCDGKLGQIRERFLEKLGELNGLLFEYFPEKRPRAKVRSLREMQAWASDNGFGDLPFFRPVNISVRNLDGKKCILLEEP